MLREHILAEITLHIINSIYICKNLLPWNVELSEFVLVDQENFYDCFHQQLTLECICISYSYCICLCKLDFHRRCYDLILRFVGRKYIFL